MKSTMPASGRDRDARFDAISVTTLMVSPSKSGWGNVTSVMPRLAMVVPSVVSLTEMPIIRPEGEERVHEGLSPLGLGGAEMRIDMQRLRIERHVGKQHVVHLRHGARQPVRHGFADDEILEIQAAAGMSPVCSRSSLCSRSQWPNCSRRMRSSRPWPGSCSSTRSTLRSIATLTLDTSRNSV